MSIKKLFIVLLLFISNDVFSLDKFIVQDIHFEGLQRITVDTALSKVPVATGSIINTDDIVNIIQSLFSTGNFEDVKVLRDKNQLIIQVKERPIIAEIIFSGNRFIKNEFLKKNFDQLNIRVGEVLDYMKIVNIKKSLEDFYHSIGKYNATIKIVVTPLPYNRVNLKLVFFEGVSAKIRQINIIGNKFFTVSELVSNFQLHDDISWWNLVVNKKYQKQKLIGDLKILQDFYLNRGYVKFNINSINVNLTPNKKDIYIAINITEGNKYTISSIELNGNIAEYYNKINQLITIKPASVYNNAKIINTENKIKNFLYCYGYASPNIITKLKINDKNKTVKLYINVDTGNRFYVRHIHFVGNYFSKDSVLRREISQMEGAWLDNNLVNLGKERLKKTGFFETVNVEIQHISNIPDQVNVIYKVKERNTGFVNFGIGFGTESGISFQISLRRENWLGTGNFVGISANKNDYSTYTELSLTNPYFMVDNVSLGGRLFYSDFNAKDADLSRFNNKYYGFNNTLSFPLNKNNTFLVGTGFVHNFLSNMKPQVSMWRYLSSIYKNFNFDTKEHYSSNDFSIDLGWSYNNLNHALFPTTGNKTSLNSKITTPGSDNKYYKIRFDTSQYYPINRDKKWVLLSRAQLGYGNGFNGKELPFYENFYAGGVSTVRSFHTNNIGPKAIYLEQKNGVIMQKFCNPSSDPVGGNAIVTASLELITPTPFTDETYANVIRTSFFIDAGTVWDSNWSNTPINWIEGMPNYGKRSNIRISTGISLRWMSPLGPLVFSYAKPIKYYEGDRFEEFQFNIGNMW